MHMDHIAEVRRSWPTLYKKTMSAGYRNVDCTKDYWYW